MKKAIIVLVALFLAITGKAFAGIDVVDIYLSDDSQLGSGIFANRGENPEYQLSENPVLFMHLTDPSTFRASFWKNPTGTEYYGGLIWSDPDNDNYAFLPNWSVIGKVEGDWSAKGLYSGSDYQLQTVTKNFSFVPEPISTTLFLLGSGVLGAHTLRRKKS